MNDGRKFTHEVLPPGQQSRPPWATWLQPQLDRLFIVALLLSADPEIAEASIVSVIETIDCSQLPSRGGERLLEEAIATLSVQHAMRSPVRNEICDTRHLVPPELWPVPHLPPDARVSFVALALLGYDKEWCAQVLGLAKNDVAVLFAAASQQLVALYESSKSNTFEWVQWAPN